MSRNKIPEALRASFLHEEDLEALILDDDEETRDNAEFDGNERLDNIIEEDDGDDESPGLIDNTTKNSNSISDTNMAAHRPSSRGFTTMCDSFRVTSPHIMASMAASKVKSRFQESLSESLLKDYATRDCIAPFGNKEIVLGKKLGSGEFSHVYLVKSFRLKDNELKEIVGSDEMETRQYMKGREKYRDTNKSSYALKHLRPELLDKYSATEYAHFASDLVQEAEFLSLLQHPNIIKLRGTSCDDYLGFEQGPKGYFLIIDRLNETLDHRIAKWKKNNGKSSIIKTIARKESNDDGRDLLSEQLEILLQITAAFVYLHEKNIIFRDLKPANVGFDVRGDVKLFDFGLAKMMPPDGDSYQEVFEMSGAGSPRYMAPEVMGETPTYNLKADVYTFGILMWEVLALQKPYAFARGMSCLVDYVCKSTSALFAFST